MEWCDVGRTRNSLSTPALAQAVCGLIATFSLANPTVFAQTNDDDDSFDAEITKTLEEIIVRAEKRSNQVVQDLPLAISVLTEETIRHSGMETIMRLTDLHPSVFFDQAHSFQNSSLKVRGIGTFGNGRTFEGAVGVFTDGVYRTRSGMALSELLDVDNVQVLRGPQGTLFGKNTVAGAISLESVSPDPNEVSGFAEARAGNLDTQYLTAAVNVPVGNDSALRLAGVMHQRDGSIVSPDNDDQYNSVDRYGLKAQYLYSPHDGLEAWIIADHAESDAECCWATANVFNGPTAPLIETYAGLNGLTFVQPPVAERERLQSLNTLPTEEVEDSGLTAIVRWELGESSLRSISAYRRWEHRHVEADPDFVAADLFILNEPTEITTLSQEFNWSLPLGPMETAGESDLLLGAYFAKEDFESTRSAETGADADNYLNALVSAGQGAVACLPPVVAADCLFPVGIGALLPDGEFTREFYFQDTTTYALFAHARWDFSSDARLVTGIRYSIEDKDGGVDNLFWYDSAIVRAALEAAGIPDDGTPRNGLDLIGTVYSPSFVDETEDREVTGTISFQYYGIPDVMMFVGFRRGYKAGGVNLFREGVVSNTTTYEPEFVDHFEAGLKADYWANKARTNVAVFHSTFTDLQFNFFTGLEFRTENTGEATSKGVELENQFQVTDELRLDLSVTYLDSQFDQLNNPFLSYLDGRDTPRAPRWAGIASLFYELPLGNGLNLFARGMGSYTGSHFVGADVPNEQKVDSYVIADANLGIRRDDGSWEIMAWCRNCGDETYRTIFFNSTFQPGSFTTYLNNPRLYGVSLRYAF